jgi:transposase
MRFTTTSVHQPQGSKMQIQTILNRVEKQKGFVYSKASFNKKGELEIQVRPRSNSRAICSGCGKKGSTYDHSSVRQFQFVPLWGIAVFLVYSMRRVNCKERGVTTERVPWACGKNQHTYSFRLFLATWANRLELASRTGRVSQRLDGSR